MMRQISVVLSILLSMEAFPMVNSGKAPLLPVPIIRQATQYSCGVAALLSVFYYWKTYVGGESSLYVPLKTSEKEGTPPWALASYAKTLGLKAEWREGVTLEEIEKAIEKKEPVIVDFQAWADKPIPASYKDDWADGHAAVVVGIDAGKIYFMDPSVPSAYAYLGREEFLSRWHDEGLFEGKLRRVHQLAVFIRGKERLETLPAPLVKVQ